MLSWILKMASMAFNTALVKGWQARPLMKFVATEYSKATKAPNRPIL